MKSPKFGIMPTKEEILELEEFQSLPLDKIIIVKTKQDLNFAKSEISKSTYVGFDTESKPSFIPNQPQTGPHLIQIATKNYVFLFRYAKLSNSLIADILQDEKIIKLGFGLSNDKRIIQDKFGITPTNMFDLSRAFKKFGYKQSVGIKGAVALTLHKKLRKSKSVTTSNWAKENLTEKQIQYAADDAYACIPVYETIINLENKINI